jgi:hypothetical protein
MPRLFTADAVVPRGGRSVAARHRELTDDAKTPTNGAATKQSFEADVSRLMHLMVHSVYSDHEIFVRERVLKPS